MEFQDNNKSHEAEKPEEMKIMEYDKRKKKLGGMKAIPFILGEFVLDLADVYITKVN
jgi:peptide/histidine transporter 3/4